jgi:hypothetical protein
VSGQFYLRTKRPLCLQNLKLCGLHSRSFRECKNFLPFLSGIEKQTESLNAVTNNIAIIASQSAFIYRYQLVNAV